MFCLRKDVLVAFKVTTESEMPWKKMNMDVKYLYTEIKSNNEGKKDIRNEQIFHVSGP